MTYSKEAADQGWTETVLERLTGGINTQERSELLKPDQLLRVENLNIIRGTLTRDSGYTAFAQGGSDDTLEDVPQACYQFYKKNGSSELICIAKNSVYKYNTAKDEWQYVKGPGSTTLNANHVLNDTNLTVVSSTGFANGQAVGLLLDSGFQFRTTVSAVPDATHVTVAAIPSAASIGALLVRAVVLTGADDSSVSVVTYAGNDWLIFTNGVNVPYRYDGTDCVVLPGLPSGGNVICKSIAIYNAALFLFNTIEGGTAYPQRVRRSEIGDPTTWTGGTAGYDDLLDSSDYLIAAEVLGPYLIVYKERTIYRGQFVNTGGVYYSFDSVVKGEGIASAQGIIDMGDYHIFVGNTNIYEYRGDFSIDPIGDNVFYNLFSFDADINTSVKIRAFAFFVEELNECWFFITTSSGTFPNKLFKYSVTEEAWVVREFAHDFVGYGFYQVQDTFIWNDLVGRWDEQLWKWNSRSTQADAPTTLLCSSETNKVYEYDYTTVNDDGIATAPSIIETRDFVTPDGEFRTDVLDLYARGATIEVEYSVDLGGSWHPWGTVSSSVFKKNELHKQVVTDAVRFRITCSDPLFVIKWLGLTWRPESE